MKADPQAASAAFKVLKSHPDFARAQVELMDGVGMVNEATPADKLPRMPSPERLEYAIKILNAQAGAYLKLVSDMRFQEAFEVVLLGIYIPQAWDTYSGLARGIVALDGNKEFKVLADQLMYWRRESFRRIASDPIGEASGIVPTVPKKLRQSREPKPELLVNAETVNRKLAAEALGMSERTFDRHVADGKLTPFGAGSRKRFNSKELLRFLRKKSDEQ
jgi:hypothetical protein